MTFEIEGALASVNPVVCCGCLLQYKGTKVDLEDAASTNNFSCLLFHHYFFFASEREISCLLYIACIMHFCQGEFY